VFICLQHIVPNLPHLGNWAFEGWPVLEKSSDNCSSTLPLNDITILTDSNTTGATLNVGGPVWSMGWAPIGHDSSTQYVAMTVYQTMDNTYQLDIPLQHNGAIQLWSVLLGDQPRLGVLYV